MSFLHPHLLLLTLLAPLAAWAAHRLWRRRLGAAEEWASRGLWSRLLAGWQPGRIALSVALVAVGALGAALALAQPRWGTALETVEREGVDVIYVLDASLSMGVTDATPSRLAVAKTLIRRLIRESPGNRLGLVGVQGEGIVLSPLTTDVAVIDLVLDGVEPGSLPVQGTELRHALELLPRLYPPGSERHRAAVILSDGEDHGGGMGTSLQGLAEAGVVVHAVGIGTPEGAPVPLPGAAGAPVVKRRADGSLVISSLREEVLEQITRATGGVYLRATDGARSLRPILAALDSMDTHHLETSTVSTRAERFQWPLALAALGLLLHLALPPFRPVARRRGGAPAEEVP
jgi:Ca-activated chloride channel family protein